MKAVLKYALVAVAILAATAFAVGVPDELIPDFPANEEGGLLSRRAGAGKLNHMFSNGGGQSAPNLGDRFKWDDIPDGTHVSTLRTQTSIPVQGALGAAPGTPLHFYKNSTAGIWVMSYGSQTQYVLGNIAYVLDKANAKNPVDRCALVKGWTYAKQEKGWEHATYTGVQGGGNEYIFSGLGNDIGGGKNPVAYAAKVKYTGHGPELQQIDFAQDICNGGTPLLVRVKGTILFDTHAYSPSFDESLIALPQVCRDIPLDVAAPDPRFYLSRFASCGLDIRQA